MISFFSNVWGRQNSFCWQCMVYYRDLWNLSNGNTRLLYVYTATVTMYGRPDVTLMRSAAHYVIPDWYSKTKLICMVESFKCGYLLKIVVAKSVYKSDFLIFLSQVDVEIFLYLIKKKEFDLVKLFYYSVTFFKLCLVWTSHPQCVCACEMSVIYI